MLLVMAILILGIPAVSKTFLHWRARIGLPARVLKTKY
jgi:hypothetical protein